MQASRALRPLLVKKFRLGGGAECAVPWKARMPYSYRLPDDRQRLRRQLLVRTVSLPVVWVPQSNQAIDEGRRSGSITEEPPIAHRPAPLGV